MQERLQRRCACMYATAVPSTQPLTDRPPVLCLMEPDGLRWDGRSDRHLCWPPEVMVIRAWESCWLPNARLGEGDQGMRCLMEKLRTWASVMVVSVKASASLGCAVLLPPMMSACAWLSRALVSASTEAGSPSTHWNFTLLGNLSLSLKTYVRGPWGLPTSDNIS